MDEDQTAADSKFVDKVASLSIWGYDKDDGSRYAECETPSDGAEDSHEALMGLIEEARAIQKARA